MADTDAALVPFAPLQPVEGYLPIEDHGLIGDGTTTALVARDGAVAWLCLPRFDSQPLFCRLLDAQRGGAFVITPDDLLEARQFYEPDTAVLVTEMRSRTGLVRVTDALAVRTGADLTEDVPAGRGELLRSVRVLEGQVRLRIAVQPRGGAVVERRGDGLRLRCATRPELDLQLVATAPLEGLQTLLDLQQGQSVDVVLAWGPGSPRYRPLTPQQLLEGTLQAWRRWSTHVEYAGPQEALVRRSALTLKLLDNLGSGAMLAAPTSSLPEAIGGTRNWDYRYAWVRDAGFAVYALHRLGLTREAGSYVSWVLDAFDRGGQPRVLYDVDGQAPPPERGDPELEGYRGSRPVRWGNAAADQVQHDVYGEIVDCAYLWAARGGTIDEGLWARLRTLVEAARTVWQRPDQGIWEVRTPGRVFTYSAALCQVALDRGVRISQQLGLPGDTEAWRADAEQIRQAILEQAWDPARNSLTEHLGGGSLDASLLTLPLRRVLPADHPRMVATADAISRVLAAGDGLLYRYLPGVSPDGLAGKEGAFLLCSFWLVENLARQGRLEEAIDLFDRLCARAGPLGLLPEQIDPTTGAFLGNYPQAFSHIGLVSAGVNLARLLARQRR